MTLCICARAQGLGLVARTLSASGPTRFSPRSFRLSSASSPSSFPLPSTERPPTEEQLSDDTRDATVSSTPGVPRRDMIDLLAGFPPIPGRKGRQELLLPLPVSSFPPLPHPPSTIPPDLDTAFAPLLSTGWAFTPSADLDEGVVFLRKTYPGGDWSSKLRFVSEVNAIAHLHNHHPHTINSTATEGTTIELISHDTFMPDGAEREGGWALTYKDLELGRSLDAAGDRLGGGECGGQ